jgi:hypothetical protein
LKKALIFVIATVVFLAMAVPVFAATGADGAGAAFGQHHAACAKDMGFSGTMNPGVMHRGFSGWTGM